MKDNYEQAFMDEAVKLSSLGVEQGEGGPFGCVVVKDGQIVGRGWNQVLLKSDPTAHAEVIAIRDACEHLQTHQLTDCIIYTSCEPCPMCLGAIYWSRPAKVYYANSRQDAADIGFDDSFIYEQVNIAHKDKLIPFIKVDNAEAISIFEKWAGANPESLY